MICSVFILRLHINIIIMGCCTCLVSDCKIDENLLNLQTFRDIGGFNGTVTNCWYSHSSTSLLSKLVSPWSNKQKEVPPVLILYSFTVEASQPFEPIRVATCRCDKHAEQHNRGDWRTVTMVTDTSLIFSL